MLGFGYPKVSSCNKLQIRAHAAVVVARCFAPSIHVGQQLATDAKDSEPATA